MDTRDVYDVQFQEEMQTKRGDVMKAVDRTLEAVEIIKVVKAEEPDEVDSLKLVEQDGIECLISQEDCDYQGEHESGVDWNSRNEDEDR